MPSRPEVGDSVERALEIVANGGLVAIPTETVYGLAADADSERAVRSIFAAKGRPADHPLIVHVGGAAELSSWADTIPSAAARLADTCWPGPLTLLVPRAARVLDVVTGGRSTVGVRVPAHPLTLDLLHRLSAGRGTSAGLAAPSANRFGKVSPTTALHVAADLGDLVDYVLDGGPCPIGVESTIVDCSVEPPQVLRPGGIGVEEVSALLDGVLSDSVTGPSRASGMLASHYAPDATVHLVETADEARQIADGLSSVTIIDHQDDLVGYARSLYAELRSADADGVGVIVAVLPPARGLGHAIRDRLTKAAHR